MKTKLLNTHTAEIDGVRPGTAGEFDTDNPGVKKLISAKKLVPVAADKTAPAPAPAADKPEKPAKG